MTVRTSIGSLSRVEREHRLVDQPVALAVEVLGLQPLLDDQRVHRPVGEQDRAEDRLLGLEGVRRRDPGRHRGGGTRAGVREAVHDVMSLGGPGRRFAPRATFWPLTAEKDCSRTHVRTAARRRIAAWTPTSCGRCRRPLKDRYRADPGAAVVTLSATGTLGEGVSCSVQTGRAIAEAGLHPASGGDGSQLCSGDMLLEALVACAGVTLRAVATSHRASRRRRRPVSAPRATSTSAARWASTARRPSGFSAIRLSIELETDAGEEQVATLLRLTERYCVVLQTLARTPQLSTSLAAA